MIVPDFLVSAGKKGYYCRYGDFYLDPLEPVGAAVISHAHGDHASPGHGMSYCTSATAAFIQSRFTRVHLADITCVDFGVPFRLGDVQLTLIPAGHILGSAQILMEYLGVRYLYTGDFKMQPDTTCEALQIVPADVLVTETTFADPAIRHPDPVAEIEKLAGIPHPIMLGAYSLGKAQRLTAMINRHCPGKNILVHHAMAPLHRIYEHFGRALGPYSLYNRRLMKSPSPTKNIYLVPPTTFRSYVRARDVVRIFASGWEQLQRHNHTSLYLSDHVDWADLLRFIEEVRPREIWTIHGDGTHLMRYFGTRLPIRSL